VDKDELLQKIWSDSIVEETSLAKNISVLRKVLSENGSANTYIETIPKRGYRFTTPIKEVETDSMQVIENEKPKLRFSVKKKISFISAISVLLFVFVGYWWSTTKSGEAKTNSDIKSVAVLPFKPLTSNEEDETLGLGMADALIIKLGQLNRVNVTPTSNIRRFTTQQTDAVSAGKSLNVESVLEGTIQRTSDRIRITAQLINVADGRQIWSDKFEERTTDFFVLQDAIAVRVANSLVAQFTEAERQRMARRGTNNLEALRFNVLGWSWSNQETTEGFTKAIEYFNKALELDPNFTESYLGLSYTYREAAESHLSPREAMPKARMYAEKVLEKDPSLSDVQYQIASVKVLYEWDWAGAEADFKRALELDPNYAHAHYGYASFLSFMGRRDEALAELETAKRIAPLNIIGSNVLYRTGEYDRALLEATKALEMNPKRISSLQWSAMVYEYKGMYPEAIETFEKARQVEDTPEMRAFEAHTFALMGEKDKALKAIEDLKETSKQRYVSPFYIATIYVGLGEKDLAFLWLEKAYQDRSFWIATLKVNPHFNNLRDDPRFQNLLKRVNLQ
ncbi:MAG TPA: tetratricopeptide repeat protein, partial [Pyrinomonadaceae bacterium]|nr:tetratricopeptide repeat protein [Pyrinomonadaceae bacterium]